MKVSYSTADIDNHSNPLSFSWDKSFSEQAYINHDLSPDSDTWYIFTVFVIPDRLLDILSCCPGIISIVVDDPVDLIPIWTLASCGAS
jgi:hypothetical protein